MVERRNRTLLDIVRSLLVLANLPTSFRGATLLTAVHVLNQVLLKSVEKISYKLWCGKKPKLIYMRVWRCVAHVLIPDIARDKLQPKTKRNLFINYLEFFKRYRLFDPMDKTL